MSLEDRHNHVNALVRQIFSGVDINNEEDPLRFIMKFHSGQKEEEDEGPLFSIEFDENLSKLTIDELNGTWSDDLRNETVLLEKVDELVREIPTCKTIELRLDDTDFFTTRCGHSINLIALQIFETGESFYNQFGYRRLSYNGDKKANDEIRRMTVSKAMEKLLASYIRDWQRGHIPFTQKYPNFSEYMKKITMKSDYALDLKKYIKNTFKQIKYFPKEKCAAAENTRAEMVAYVINAFGELLTADSGDPFIKEIQFEQQKIIIMEAVHKVFEGFFIAEYGDDYNYFRSVRCKITDKRTGQSCLTLEFVEHDFYKEKYGEDGDMEFHPTHEGLVVLYIESLDKCGENRGNSLLVLVDELAKLIPFIEYIALEDASHLKKCDKTVTLFQLKILASATGDSWYVSKGYKTQTHDEVMAHNMRLRNRNMAELLEVVDPSVKTDIMEAFPELDHGMTVHDCFKMISDQISSFPEKGCSEEQNKKIEALDRLMSVMMAKRLSDFQVKQHRYLFKRVLHGGYKRRTKKRGGTKKRITKKRATKKRWTKCSKNLPQHFL